MKSPKMKTLALSAACLALALTITACNDDKANTANQTPSPSSSETAIAPPASESPSASPTAEETDVLTAEGEYTGMIDGHSIEIKMDGQATAFQVDFDTADKLSDWEMGTRVKFQYSVKNLDVDGEQIQQLTIESIDKA